MITYILGIYLYIFRILGDLQIKIIVCCCCYYYYYCYCYYYYYYYILLLLAYKRVGCVYV